MSLVYLPHTASVETASQKIVGNTASGRATAPAVSVKCQVSPGNAKIIYEQHNIQVDSPYLLMTNFENAALFTVGSIVTFGNLRLIVRAHEDWAAIPTISFCSVMLDVEKKA